MRNQDSHFALSPGVNIGRSKMNMNSSVKFSFDTGEIIPFYIQECLPADTVQIRTNKVVRLQTPITPFMDNMYLDTYYFFVPNRLVWEHWKQFNGENKLSAWYPTVEYEVPQIEAPENGWNIGTIADYMGIPTGVELSVNALPFRAYALICNEFFRDENLSDPLVVPFNDSTVTGVNTGTFVTDVAKGGLPYTAAKFHDYFTSCLPAPQKGPDVVLPTELGAKFPVVTGDAHDVNGNINLGFSSFIKESGATEYEEYDYAGQYNYPLFVDMSAEGFDKRSLSYGNSSSSYGSGHELQWIPNNLWADTSAGASFATTINQLRTAFQIQKLYEKDSHGTRYNEVLKIHFGVTSPDSRLQRPEYLGGNRIPINVNQVVQNSATDDVSPQGNTAAYSLTTDSNGDFIRSFTEHGFIIGVCVARYDHTYQQGLERMWSRKTRFDYYWPVLANLGEQAVLNKEIYATGTDTDDEVFGYQERWGEYRFKPSRIAGQLRSQAETSLDVWHLGDFYESLPYLSDEWIREDKSNVDRVLAVSSSVSNQLLADFYIQNTSTRPMPVYSIPGLIDHH